MVVVVVVMGVVVLWRVSHDFLGAYDGLIAIAQWISNATPWSPQRPPQGPTWDMQGRPQAPSLAPSVYLFPPTVTTLWAVLGAGMCVFLLFLYYR